MDNLGRWYKINFTKNMPRKMYYKIYLRAVAYKVYLSALLL